MRWRSRRRSLLRCAPLTVAVAKSGCPHTLANDERGAGFLALGYARGSGRCAAVLVSSGTAVANLLPAVVEAAQDIEDRRATGGWSLEHETKQVMDAISAAVDRHIGYSSGGGGRARTAEKDLLRAHVVSSGRCSRAAQPDQTKRQGF